MASKNYLSKSFFSLFVLFSMAISLAETAETVKLKYTPQCIFKAVLQYRKVDFRPELPLPKIRLKSQSSLNEVNEALYPAQWTSPQTEFSNAFAYMNGYNDIFLNDDAGYYKRHGRFLDDSLAHELFHYLQVRYMNMKELDDFAEFDAIVFQNWFRDTFMVTDQSPCEN